MTPLTIRERARTFPLDQLLDARRRGVRVCLTCGDTSTPLRRTECDECLRGTGHELADPEDLIVMNLKGHTQ